MAALPWRSRPGLFANDPGSYCVKLLLRACKDHFMHTGRDCVAAGMEMPQHEALLNEICRLQERLSAGGG